jgi:putative transposase
LRSLTPHILYQALGSSDKERQSAYRAPFRIELDREAIDDMRLDINQDQLIGNEGFLAKIEKMTGIRRQARPRGWPRLSYDAVETAAESQGALIL